MGENKVCGGQDTVSKAELGQEQDIVAGCWGPHINQRKKRWASGCAPSQAEAGLSGMLQKDTTEGSPEYGWEVKLHELADYQEGLAHFEL